MAVNEKLTQRGPIPLFIVDAFAEARFQGNPAAVCPLDAWLPDEVMQRMAAEHNLSETAFLVPETGGYRLRWFTPVAEVNLCGHATLASAFVVFERLGFPGTRVEFHTLSGTLAVERRDGGYEMDFPSQAPLPCPMPPEVVDALGRSDLPCFRADDYLVAMPSEADVRASAPRIEPLRHIDLRGLILTAPGDSVDFVSRFFCPKFGINEDPVTGSAHCILAPYWSPRLGKTEMQARQISARGGSLRVRLAGPRVFIIGKAVLYSEGSILPA
jgi:predicted PhzF superfamily epimerase YddE/YHI9